VLGWDNGGSEPVPTASQLRWNALTNNYEVLLQVFSDWAQLSAIQDSSSQPPSRYELFTNGGAKLSPYMLVYAPPAYITANGFVGEARAVDGNKVITWFTFGPGTDPDNVPRTGIETCSFGEDEIGGGDLIIDFGTGTTSGWLEPFWGKTRYQLTGVTFAPGATTISARFGANPEGTLEARFFGPGAENIGIRAKGGGTGFESVVGIMLGDCKLE
jgi:hypothetical protein